VLPESLMTAQELMALLRYSRSGLNGLVRSRRIPSLLVGGRLRFRRRDIEAFLRAAERPAVSRRVSQRPPSRNADC
jgi:excisionase family DNA binding protein